MKLLFNYIALVVSILGFNFLANAQGEANLSHWNNGLKNWELFQMNKENSKQMIEHWNKIEESLNTTSNPYAGIYYHFGELAGYFFIWSPEQGFIYITFYDSTIVLDFSFGKASATDKEIVFTTQRELKDKYAIKYFNIKTTWIPAFDGKLLVPKEEVKEFGKMYGGFGKYNRYPNEWWLYELRPFAIRKYFDRRKSQTSSFVLPSQYEKFIVKPINGEIISIGKRKVVFNKEESTPKEKVKSSVTDVTLNVGRKDGVRRNLIFLFLDAGDNLYQVLKITHVGNKTSRGIVIRDVNDNDEDAYFDGYEKDTEKIIYKPFPPIRIGTKVTTSPILVAF